MKNITQTTGSLEMIKATILLAAALMLGACATVSAPPKPVAGQADTMLFRVHLNIGATDSAADQRAAGDFEDFRTKNGYRAFNVIDRRFVDMPARIEYVVRFSK